MVSFKGLRLPTLSESKGVESLRSVLKNKRRHKKQVSTRRRVLQCGNRIADTCLSQKPQREGKVRLILG
jgi:hypothetical protein